MYVQICVVHDEIIHRIMYIYFAITLYQHLQIVHERYYGASELAHLFCKPQFTSICDVGVQFEMQWSVFAFVYEFLQRLLTLQITGSPEIAINAHSQCFKHVVAMGDQQRC